VEKIMTEDMEKQPDDIQEPTSGTTPPAAPDHETPPEPQPAPPPKAEMAAGDISDDDRLWAVLSWIVWIIAVFALVLEEKRDRPYVRYHAWHSIVVGVLCTVISFVTFGCGTPVFLITLYFAYRAYQGDYVEIPAVTNFIKGQGWI
jgi:uncharacterized membrane protein